MNFIEIFQPLLRFIAGNHRRRSLGPFRGGGPNAPPPPGSRPKPPPAPPPPDRVTKVVRVRIDITQPDRHIGDWKPTPPPPEVDWNRGPHE